jgi:hypothetical protein
MLFIYLLNNSKGDSPLQSIYSITNITTTKIHIKSVIIIKHLNNDFTIKYIRLRLNVYD